MSHWVSGLSSIKKISKDIRISTDSDKAEYSILFVFTLNRAPDEMPPNVAFYQGLHGLTSNIVPYSLGNRD